MILTLIFGLPLRAVRYYFAAGWMVDHLLRLEPFKPHHVPVHTLVTQVTLVAPVSNDQEAVHSLLFR
jgi:hypothetical protein